MSRLLGRVVRHRPAFVGSLMVATLVLAALVGPVLHPADPLKLAIAERALPPGPGHWFGTDDFGRDVLSRVLHGARISLQVGTLVVGVAAVAGTLLGLLAGYYGRWVDSFIMRAMDVLMAFPDILLAIGLMAVLGPGLGNLVIALGVLYTPRFARLVRGTVLTLRELEYVAAVRAAGGSDLRVMFGHVLPNALSPVIVQATVYFAYAILAEAALSFLGLGAPPPTPSWGNILYDGRNFLQDGPWMSLFAGGAISFAVLGINLLGDGLRDLLDPRLRT